MLFYFLLLVSNKDKNSNLDSLAIITDIKLGTA